MMMMMMVVVVVVEMMMMITTMSQDSVVCLVTGYGLNDRGVGVRVPEWSRIFFSPRHPDRIWGSPKFLSNEYRGLFPRGLKWPRREADHSLPASAEFKKIWI
jgi:hypothetical protein